MWSSQKCDTSVVTPTLVTVSNKSGTGRILKFSCCTFRPVQETESKVLVLRALATSLIKDFSTKSSPRDFGISVA